MVTKKKGKTKAKKVSKASTKKKKVVPMKEKSVLSHAIKDLENEIKRIGSERTKVDGTIKGLSSNIDEDREMQVKLQKKIADLLEKEAKLNEKKKGLETKMDKLSDKLNKMSKIKSEMSEL